MVNLRYLRNLREKKPPTICKPLACR